MRIASAPERKWRCLATLVQFVGLHLSFHAIALAEDSAPYAADRYFFVPRDASTGHLIPGPPLPNHLTKLLGTLDELSDEQCLHLYLAINAQPATEESEKALNEVLTAFAQFNRHVPLTQLMSIPIRAFVREGWYNSVTSFSSPWEKTKPEESAKWLADQGTRFLPAEEVSDLIAYAIYNWGYIDPSAASEFAVHVPLAVNLPSGYDPNNSLYWYLRKVVRLRASSDLSGTLAWATALPDTDPRRTVALCGVLDRMVEVDPDQAKNFVRRQLSSNKDAPKLAAQLAVVLAGRQPDDAGLWALSLSDAPARRAALNDLVDAWLTKVTPSWMQSDVTPEVVQWASLLPPGDRRGEAWSAVAAQYGTMRPLAAKDWLGSLPTGPDRDAAMTAYDEAIINAARKKFTGRYPAQAFYWLQTNLLDQKRATELVKTMFSEWAKKDPIHAQEWADGHGVKMPSTTAAP